jgi:hypothetical protein
MAAILFIGMGFDIVQSAKAAAFSDISGHWAEASIEAALSQGYVNGYEDGTFRPDQAVSRAEFIKMVDMALMLNIPELIPGDDWYVPFVNVAVNGGFHRWDDFNEGDWNSPITRLEIARLATRAAKLSVEVETTDTGYMYEAVKAGLIQGVDGGHLNPGKETTRAQSIVLVERILDKISGDILEVDEDALSYAAYEDKGTNAEVVLKKYEITPVSFPVNVETGDEHVSMSIDKLIVVDYDRMEGAFRDWFPAVEYVRKADNGRYEVATTDGTDKPGFFLVAFHTIVSNDAKRAGGFNPYKALYPTGLAGSASIATENINQTPIHMINSIAFPKYPDSQTIDGWRLVTLPKSEFEEWKYKMPIKLVNTVDHNSIIYFNIILNGNE